MNLFDADIVDGGLKFGTATAKVEREVTDGTKAKKVTIGRPPRRSDDQDQRRGPAGRGGCRRGARRRRLPVRPTPTSTAPAPRSSWRVDGRNHPNPGGQDRRHPDAGAHPTRFDVETGEAPVEAGRRLEGRLGPSDPSVHPPNGSAPLGGGAVPGFRGPGRARACRAPAMSATACASSRRSSSLSSSSGRTGAARPVGNRGRRTRSCTGWSTPSTAGSVAGPDRTCTATCMLCGPVWIESGRRVRRGDRCGSAGRSGCRPEYTADGAVRRPARGARERRLLDPGASRCRRGRSRRSS